MEAPTSDQRFCPICGAYHAAGPCIMPATTPPGPESTVKLYKGLAITLFVLGTGMVALGITAPTGPTGPLTIFGAVSLAISAWGFVLFRKATHDKG